MQKLLVSFKLNTRIPSNVCTKNVIKGSSSRINTRELLTSSISTTKSLSNASSSIPPKSQHNIFHEAFSKSLVLNPRVKNQSVNLINGGVVVARGRNLYGNSSVGSSNQRYSASSRGGGGGGGWWFPSADTVLWGLIGANAVVFTMWRIADPSFMKENFMISLDNFKRGRVHTLITSAFGQISNGHFISNIIGLFVFGNTIGKLFGPQFLLKLYFAGAICGSVFYLVHHAFMDTSKIVGHGQLGASGAVDAIMLLYIFLFPKSTLYVYLVIPVPAMLVGAFFVAEDLYRMKKADGRITGGAPFGGATVAAIAWLGIRRGWWI